ncbi:hypothetical protein ECG_01222 [Echinococcus granulosus]|uniref:Expressed protein n=1 Tax=Echinococcus granulosus TaxID=6210 RepID=A0A068WE39_ECHGR|nr:hypothetical protein ECG_01222 [Echinococcus granulosus]CDS15881.1 expressed protein [Echinococcus granulosus]
MFARCCKFIYFKKSDRTEGHILYTRLSERGVRSHSVNGRLLHTPRSDYCNCFSYVLHLELDRKILIQK